MRKRTRRKQYFPMSGLDVVAQRNAKPDRSSTLDALLAVSDALEKLRVGAMTRKEWDKLAMAINIAHVLANDKKIGHEYLSQILDARASALTLGRRAVQTGSFVARAEELNALRDFAEIHEAQISLATQGEIIDSRDRVFELIRSGYKASPKEI